VAAEINAYYAGLLRLLDCPVVRLALWLTPARAYLRSPKKNRADARGRRQLRQGARLALLRRPAGVILTTPRRHRRFGRVNATIAGDQQKLYAAPAGSGLAGSATRRWACAAAARPATPPGSRRSRAAGGVHAGTPGRELPRLPARAPLPVTWLGD
jgi:hypothetical protein